MTRTRAARIGVGGAVVWLVLEVSVRWGAAVAYLVTLDPGRRPPDAATTFWVNAALMWPAATLALVVFGYLARRARMSWRALGYRSWRAGLLPGLLAAGAIMGAGWAFDPVDHWLFGTDVADRFDQAARAAGPGAVLVMLPANGILGPLAEELAWRGYVQTHLVAAWGPLAGVAATSLMFAVKHVIVDLSPARLFVLLSSAFILGVCGRCWGTSASTVAHVAVNVAATSLAAFGAG